MIKLSIKEAITTWNQKNPELRKKTLGSVAEQLGVTASSLSQIENSNQFKKHLSVIVYSKNKKKQVETFALYKKVDIPVINKLAKITKILDCEIYDIVKFE